jgi:hypothetical protein
LLVGSQDTGRAPYLPSLAGRPVYLTGA